MAQVPKKKKTTPKAVSQKPIAARAPTKKSKSPKKTTAARKSTSVKKTTTRPVSKKTTPAAKKAPPPAKQKSTRAASVKNTRAAAPAANLAPAVLREALRQEKISTPPPPTAQGPAPADLREALRAEKTPSPPPPPARATPEDEVKKIRESAERLGIQLNEQEALQWLAQMAVQDTREITLDARHSVYGAKVAILDFSPQDLEYFRRIGKIVAIPDEPGVVETALALSGSAAQSKIQTNPGDADFFQRVNIIAPTREAAVQILADVMRAKGLATLRGADYQLLSVKFGTHTEASTRNGKPIKKGSPMTWYPRDLEAGAFEVELPDGSAKTIRWQDGMVEPGWTKLDWVVADAQRGILANASNLLDATWQNPEHEIVALDGMIDPYFQEVYLDAASVPVFSKLVKHVDDQATDEYVAALEREVYKYLVKNLNYGKVAKRAYNVFRMSGRFTEAAYIREIFDEPTTALYRIWSLFETLSGAATPDSMLDRVALLKQYDALIDQVIQSTEGEKERRIVRALMQARDEALGIRPMVESFDKTFETPREDVMNLLNEYFHDLLYGFAPVAEFLEEIRQRHYDN